MAGIDINWAAWVPVFALILAFVVYCIIDIVRRDVRFLPKWAWTVICLCSIPLGAIAYLIIGRDPGRSA